ncbi:unnamed protein product [Allacma fusca]|uniref:Uncharacterized protein n=1 Tax=Allacma fusca TaxID=39272 RepID=A0A8J2JTD0_9HEXA|nr:unnamed protein product [Allacma fusca]
MTESFGLLKSIHIWDADRKLFVTAGVGRLRRNWSRLNLLDTMRRRAVILHRLHSHSQVGPRSGRRWSSICGPC